MEYLELSYKKPQPKRKQRLYRMSDEQLQHRINAVKLNMKEKFGYNDQSATDVLNHVASIVARDGF